VTNRQRLLVLVAGASLLVVVANVATGTPSTGRLPSSTPPTGEPVPSRVPASPVDLIPRIAIAYDVDVRDRAGLNELARAGVKRAAEQLGAELTEITVGPEDTDADREGLLGLLADAGYQPIFAVGSRYAGPLSRVAEAHRGTWFGIVDDGTVDAPNVIGILFSGQQGSFLVGAAAALTSKTGNVGFVGAVRDPLLQKLEAGFTAGARAARPDVKVQVAYLSQPGDDGGHGDPAKAGKAALAMSDAGADVIFGADGDSAQGVIEAASDRGFWAIGVNSDLYQASDRSVRGSVLTSMVKRADVGTYTIAMEIAKGVPKDGNNVFGLDRGGVGYSTSGGFVDPIKAQLDAYAARIAAGEIVVPSKP
jgi:basic membrane protein A and related proteins